MGVCTINTELCLSPKHHPIKIIKYYFIDLRGDKTLVSSF